jgi:hypothetical protein
LFNLSERHAPFDEIFIYGELQSVGRRVVPMESANNPITPVYRLPPPHPGLWSRAVRREWHGPHADLRLLGSSRRSGRSRTDLI